MRAYAQVSQAVMSSKQASLILHERLWREIVAAKAAYRARRLDQMCRHLDKCSRVLLALHADLKPAAGEAGPVILGGFYLHLFQNLRTILRKADVEAAYDEQIHMLRAFCEQMRSVTQS
ncbi:MAG: flagellar protein FliS [Caulobacteraceae bacterium]|nr:flagellar protein FliS [Caulobacteraceae bacterium]